MLRLVVVRLGWVLLKEVVRLCCISVNLIETRSEQVFAMVSIANRLLAMNGYTLTTWYSSSSPYALAKSLQFKIVYSAAILKRKHS